LGPETAVTAVDAGGIRWLKPLPLWSGILAGPVAWAFDLTASYAVVKPVCHTGHYGAFLAITIGSLAVVAAGAVMSWAALTRTSGDQPTDGGRPRQRARFMAVLGLTACALFGLQILAGAIPHWVLDACQ
jgi:hypothetical protein